MNRPPIKPDLKVGDLLEHYPELEATLVEIAPAFKRLKNPILRRTVARVTTLAQAAIVGGVPVAKVVNTLRAAIGAEAITMDENGEAGDGPPPAGAPVETFDARPVIERGESPLGAVLAALGRLPDGGTLRLVTSFEPAPLIAEARGRGFAAASRKCDAETIETILWRKKDH